MRFRPLLVVAALFALQAHAQIAPRLSEFVAHHAGPVDDHEYVEVFGASATDLSAFRIVVVEGRAAANPGLITNVFTPGTTNGAGFWTTGFLTSTLQSPAFTLLLVSGFTGAVGNDLDTNDDGTLDAAPWTAILDSVAVTDGSVGARTYSPAVLAPDFDGLGVAVGGASRFPYYKDTDTAADWKRNDFDGEGLPGFTGTLAPGEAVNTPGWPTRVHLADYYASVDTSSSATLRTTLHDAIKGHVQYPYTASTTDTWDILNSADEDPGDSTKILDTYKNERYTKITGGTGVYNREHSWPNSYGFPVNTMVPYTDCNHLFLTDTTYNGDRGNNPYGTCSASCTELPTTANYGYGGGSGVYPGNSNWLSGSGSSSIWESWSYRKGNLARASLYLDVRYEGGTHVVTGAFEPDLVLTDNTTLIVTKTATAASPQAWMGRLATLLAWNTLDPPDDTERHHHEVVSSYQGNRNPFIDHPEWAACVFQATGCTARLADAATIDTGAGAVGAVRHLSTSPRTATSWTWSVTTRPGASTAALSSTSIRNPTFTPDAAGDYVFQLDAGNGTATNVTTVALTASPSTCTDLSAPVVTAPAAIVVDQTLCCGVSGGVTPATSTALSAFLTGASATDDCDGAPAALAPQAGGLDVASTTCFTVGSTAVTFRFQDASSKVGTATANVTVRLFFDLNLDHVIDPSDFVVMRAYFNFVATPGVPPFAAPIQIADLNHDTIVDPSDIVIARAYFNFVVSCLAP